MSNYLIELAAIHLALILGYWCFLRKEQQYAKMRFYLIGASLLALLIPLIKLPGLVFYESDALPLVVIEAIPQEVTMIAPVSEMSINYFDLLVWLYLAISAILLIRFLGSLWYLVSLERRSRREPFNDLYIRRVPDMEGSFTFFNWIFLSDAIDKEQHEYAVILKHEEAHVRYGHSYDLLFFELFKVFFWWLPSAWFINKEIKKIHEYQADAYALRSYNLELYSSILISSTLKTNGLSMASSFHDGLIFKRLKEMKKQVKQLSPWRLGILSALCAMLFIVFACSEEIKDVTKPELPDDAPKTEHEVFTLVEEHPEFVGGMDAFYKYVAGEMRYPLAARNKGVEGQVDPSFSTTN
ncbi:MAG: hypothetical protein AAFO94_16570 [Bacteroidota bacterium]